jgi:hypothetical protein
MSIYHLEDCVHLQKVGHELAVFKERTFRGRRFLYIYSCTQCPIQAAWQSQYHTKLAVTIQFLAEQISRQTEGLLGHNYSLL